MKRFGAILLQLATLMTVSQIGYCIKCHECKSDSNKNCGDPFVNPDNSTLLDCSSSKEIYDGQVLKQFLRDENFISKLMAGGVNHCIKVGQSAADGKLNVERTCVFGNPALINEVCDRLKKLELIAGLTLFKECTVCDQDGCNSARSIGATKIVGLFAVITSLNYYMS